MVSGSSVLEHRRPATHGMAAVVTRVALKKIGADNAGDMSSVLARSAGGMSGKGSAHTGEVPTACPRGAMAVPVFDEWAAWSGWHVPCQQPIASEPSLFPLPPRALKSPLRPLRFVGVPRGAASRVLLVITVAIVIAGAAWSALVGHRVGGRAGFHIAWFPERSLGLVAPACCSPFVCFRTRTAQGFFAGHDCPPEPVNRSMAYASHCSPTMLSESIRSREDETTWGPGRTR